jgi:hypothetical protein
MADRIEIKSAERAESPQKHPFLGSDDSVKPRD